MIDNKKPNDHLLMVNLRQIIELLELSSAAHLSAPAFREGYEDDRRYVLDSLLKMVGTVQRSVWVSESETRKEIFIQNFATKDNDEAND